MSSTPSNQPTPQAAPTPAANPTLPADPSAVDPRLAASHVAPGEVTAEAAAASQDGPPTCVACDFAAGGLLPRDITDLFGDHVKHGAVVVATDEGTLAAMKRLAEQGRPFDWPQPEEGEAVALYGPIHDDETDEVTGHRVVVWF